MREKESPFLNLDFWVTKGFYFIFKSHSNYDPVGVTKICCLVLAGLLSGSMGLPIKYTLITFVPKIKERK